MWIYVEAGVIITGEKLRVEEYTETTHAKEKFLGNTGIFSCTLDFVKYGSTLSLPVHRIQKKINGSWISKKEYFIFDLFPYAKNFKILLSDRTECFAPIKSAHDLKPNFRYNSCKKYLG